MAAIVASIVSAAGVALSLIFVAWQAREVARQRRISNDIAGTSELRESMVRLHHVLTIVLERPELRPYIYEGKACPERGRRRAQVLILAEMLGDVLDVGLNTTKIITATNSYEDWEGFTYYVLERSPALRQMVEIYGSWWPYLFRLYNAKGF